MEMKSISEILNNKRQKSQCALIPFITAGYPDINTTVNALYTLDKQGADIIELGVPYSDALADGPMIQKSSEAALNNGINIEDVLSIVKTVSSQISAPIIVFTYYNPILVRGVAKFIYEISCYGAKGLIIPDLPIEETDYLVSVCTFYNIELILFIAPTSSLKRISKILSKSPGCLYVVTNTGVTGMRPDINMDTKNLLSYIHSKTNKMIMLGFGISNSVQAFEVSKWNIDAVVMGSAFVKIFDDNALSKFELINKLGSFCLDIKSSLEKVK